LSQTISIEACDATLGASVTGVDLTHPRDAEWTQIDRAFLEFGVLVFPDQHLDADAQVAFGRHFGTIEHIIGELDIVPITNQRADGSLMDDSEDVMQILRGNEGWHTDSSYMPISAKASVLLAQVVPATGGETQWADMRAAYAALDDATRDRIADLSAHHSLRYSQAQIGHTDNKDFGYGMQDDPPPIRPLVKRHPETGRPALFIGRHAYDIPGLEGEESQKLLADLLEFACQSPRVLEHRWQKGDIVIWDNRCVLHRARPFDHAEARVMRHTRISGDPTSESAPLAL
jgi:alpha-ketoglutarate-dependent taurine dioxygenase